MKKLILAALFASAVAGCAKNSENNSVNTYGRCKQAFIEAYFQVEEAAKEFSTSNDIHSARRLVGLCENFVQEHPNRSCEAIRESNARVLSKFNSADHQASCEQAKTYLGTTDRVSYPTPPGGRKKPRQRPENRTGHRPETRPSRPQDDDEIVVDDQDQEQDGSDDEQTEQQAPVQRRPETRPVNKAPKNGQNGKVSPRPAPRPAAPPPLPVPQPAEQAPQKPPQKPPQKAPQKAPQKPVPGSITAAPQPKSGIDSKGNCTDDLYKDYVDANSYLITIDVATPEETKSGHYIAKARASCEKMRTNYPYTCIVNKGNSKWTYSYETKLKQGCDALTQKEAELKADN